MREAISGTTLFMIVIMFVILFTGYLCMSINQNKAFAVKNAIIRIVERHGIGVTNPKDFTGTFKDEVSTELTTVGYRSHGRCGDGWVGFNQLGDVVSNERDMVFCIQAITSGGSGANPSQKLHYFKVKTFYQFDIPVLRTLFDLSIEGTTKPMM